MSQINTRSKAKTAITSEETSETTSAPTFSDYSTPTETTMSTNETGNERSSGSKTNDKNKKKSKPPTEGEENLDETIRPRSEATIVKQKKAASKTSAKSTRKAALEAKLKYEQIERAKLERDGAIAKTMLELLELKDDSDSELSEIDNNDLVTDWVDQTTRRKQPATKSKNDQPINNLATAIIDAIQSSSSSAPKMAPRYMSEIHPFDGNPREWTSFSATYFDTEKHFSPIENVSRLRKAVKGQARESVKSIMYTTKDPYEIIDILQRRFGRPVHLVKSEIAALEKLPNMSNDVKGIGIFASTVANSVNTIKQLNKKEYLYSHEISEKIIEKMNLMIKFRWHEYRAEHEETPILLSLSTFLNKIADQCESYDDGSTRVKREFKSENKNRQFQPRNRVNHAANMSSSSSESASEEEFSDDEYEEERNFVFAASAQAKCPFCKGNHELAKCPKFEAQNIKERWETVKRKRVCFKCLKANHRSINCTTKTCNKNGCTRKHHEMLHHDTPVTQKTVQEANTEATSSQIVSVNHVGHMRSYLKIVPVILTGPTGTIKVSALLDEGSTVTLVLNNVATSIGASGTKSELSIEGVTGHIYKDESSMRVSMKIQGECSREISDLTAYTVSELNLTSQTVRQEDLQDCPHLEDIKDQLTYPKTRPSILIGQDNWHLIVSRQLKCAGSSKPVASLTKLGWILHGCKSSITRPVLFSGHIRTVHHPNIEETIRNYFELDSIGILPKLPKNDPEQKALSTLKDTTKLLPEGRYECGLLWKEDNITMPNNRESALKRLRGIQRKMSKDETFKNKYSEQIQNLLKNDYAERIYTPSTSPRTWYLPHFAVYHPQKGKMRLVFDAAEKTNGMSLNDALLSGPDLLQSLFGVLIRFRQGSVAVAADIKEMFLRVKIKQEDRDSLRFLWQDDAEKEPEEYRMNSLIFGAASSPCSAIYVKNANAERFKDQHPDAHHAITRCHYMDDYLQSFENASEAKRVSNEVSMIHKQAGFELRGWASNCPRAIDTLTNENPETVSLGNPEKVEKTLGMLWDVQGDHLKYTLNLRNTPEDVVIGIRPPTKREVMSAIMSVFDPLGLATPVLVQGKVLIQKLWKTGIGWDETIPHELYKDWTNWMDNLGSLQDLNIPRCTHSLGNGELHTFVDASEHVYAAAVYWRSIKNGEVSIRLLAAKARVSPLKSISIPRLELQSAVLGSRLAATVEKEINANIVRKVYWSDSRTTLAWIKADPRTFKTFVAHRLAAIEELTKTIEWRWVPTKQNVADDATRTVPTHFDAKHRWFNGPEFLYKNENLWPEDKSAVQQIVTEETKRHTVSTATKVEHISCIPEPKRFSSWQRLLRSTARLLHVMEVFKSSKNLNQTMALRKTVKDKSWRKYNRSKYKYSEAKRKTDVAIKPLPDEMLDKAERLLIQTVQQQNFGTELEALKKGRPIPNSAKLRKFKLTLEEDIIHLCTRASQAECITQNQKQPIVLDGHHHITKLIIKHYHEQYSHGNHQTVMNELRQKYYITSLRSVVKFTVKQCQWCKVYKAKPQIPPISDLPKERIGYKQHAFTHVGLDYFGPLTVTIGRRTEKRWVALYTCLTTRAIHLEIANSLSADSTIMTLRRFIARRGMPKTIYSDNGTNFIGAAKELADALSGRNITWKRIPPGAPNMGGAWERMVRSVKAALNVTLKSRQPSEEVLHTLLLEAEHLVNSRPLTDVSLDPNDEESLTPNHFLIGRSSALNGNSFGEFDDQDLVGKNTWRTAQRLSDLFWKRWLHEYLPTILPKLDNGTKEFLNLAPGDIVIIVDTSLPRGCWPRGEILNTFTGSDGKIRTAEVRTPAGVLRRPTNRLIKIVAHKNSSASVLPHEGETVDDFYD